MAVYFGTDGIRGVANSSLSHDIAFKCGNALTALKKNPTVVLCKDTRISGDLILAALSVGIMSGGGKAINCNILPTAGLAYITKLYGADFGVVISASHNPFEYNGIKIFSDKGVKLSEEQEEYIEELFNSPVTKTGKEIGVAENDFKAEKLYSDFLLNSVKTDFKGLKVVLDCACGASYSIAPEVFKKLGCEVVANHTDIINGTINENCGSLFPQTLIKEVLESKADIGFAFDGDSDRVIACDENGNIVDGDKLIYILAKNMKKQGRLKNDCVVGTAHTNMGIEKSLAKCGIKLLRADIGDKYVRELMDFKNSVLGGEQSGHIIIGDIGTTGDGILSAIQICSVLKESGSTLSKLNDCFVFPQVNININVKDKLMVINNECLQSVMEKCRTRLGKEGRIMVRASGTEPKIRVMAECEDKTKAQKAADEIVTVIREISEGKYYNS